MVNFKKFPKIKFEKQDALNIKKSVKLMERDFAGLGYDPNFDFNYDNLCNYIEKFTNTKHYNFSNEQVDCIKSIFCL